MKSIVDTDFLNSLFSNSYLTAMHQCSANPSVLLQREQDDNGDHGMVVWAVQHGSIANTVYVGLFAFSNDPDATYVDTVTLTQAQVLAKYSAPNMSEVLYFILMDVFTGESIGTVLREANGTFPAFNVPANGGVLVAIIAFS